MDQLRCTQRDTQDPSPDDAEIQAVFDVTSLVVPAGPPAATRCGSHSRGGTGTPYRKDIASLSCVGLGFGVCGGFIVRYRVVGSSV